MSSNPYADPARQTDPAWQTDAVWQTEAALEARRRVEQVTAAGFTAYFAGGCVRDALMQKIPKDFDIATDATPDAVRRVFGHRKTLAIGEAFGVIAVLPATPRNTPRMPVEVATFRSDGTYQDGRRPDSVSFGNAVDDAHRRDFTINGMFYDPIAGQVIDHVGGAMDLRAGIVRAIGKPDQRFHEDKLRMLRGVRFAAALNFQIEADTLAAIRQHAASIGQVSGARIGAEMRRLLTCRRRDIGLSGLVSTQLHRRVWPGLDGVASTVLERLSTRENSFAGALAITLAAQHGKTDNALRQLRDLAGRWKLSAAETRAAAFGLRQATAILHADSLAWSQLQPVMMDPDVGVAVEVAEAMDASTESLRRVAQARALPEQELNPAPLLTGHDLIALGHPSGPHFKKWLALIRAAQLDGRIASREQAIALLAQEH